MSASPYQLNDLTPPELEALRSYKSAEDPQGGLSPCFELNALLEVNQWTDELPANLQQTALALDSVFDRCPKLQSPMTVFRGDGHRLRFRTVHLSGAEFRVMSFWSTSAEKSAAETFLRSPIQNGSGVLFRLELPAGFPVYDMESLAGAGGSEREFLLPRGVLWKVDNVTNLSASDLNAFVWKGFASIFEVAMTPVTNKWRPLL